MHSTLVAAAIRGIRSTDGTTLPTDFDRHITVANLEDGTFLLNNFILKTAPPPLPEAGMLQLHGFGNSGVGPEVYIAVTEFPVLLLLYLFHRRVVVVVVPMADADAAKG
jgi:hypothetical protein